MYKKRCRIVYLLFEQKFSRPHCWHLAGISGHWQPPFTQQAHSWLVLFVDPSCQVHGHPEDFRVHRSIWLSESIWMGDHANWFSTKFKYIIDTSIVNNKWLCWFLLLHQKYHIFFLSFLLFTQIINSIYHIDTYWKYNGKRLNQWFHLHIEKLLDF